MPYYIGDAITRDFTTENPITGQVQNADFLPTSQVFENTTDVPILTPLVVQRAALIGNYRVSFVLSAANGFEVGKSYNVIVTATVNGVTAKARIMAFNVEAQPQAAFFNI